MTILPAGSIAAGLALLQRGQVAQARQVFEEITGKEPANALAWYWLAIAHTRGRGFAAAHGAIERAIALAPNEASYRLTAANIEQDLGSIDKAIARVREAIERQPRFPEAYNNLGILLSDRDQTADARAAFATAAQQKPGYARALANLASACIRLDQPQEALAAAQQACAADPRNAHAHHTFGQAVMILGREADAEAAFRRALALQPAYVEVALLLGRLLLGAKRNDDARALVAAVATQAPRRADLWSLLGEIATGQDDVDGALKAYQQGLAIAPNDMAMTARAAMILPSIYASREHLLACRQRLIDGVEFLWREWDRLIGSVNRDNAGKLLPVNFFLGYQGMDDAAIQRRYGDFIGKTLAAALPDYFAALPRPATAGRRIRIGFCSRFFYRSTAGNYFASWITDLDRREFEIFVYYPRAGGDALTASIRAAADHFSQEDAPLAKSAERIRADRLDILVYPELGMDIGTFMLAALRLAPVQVCGWGHPVTPGLANVDAFLSCAEMEPADAAAHYNETLLPLPGIGTRYPLPTLTAEAQAKTRADFQLPEDKTLYLLPQSLFKVHPDNDALIVDILARDSAGVLVMFAGHSQSVTQRFVTRLTAAFEQRGLAPAGRVKILPALSHDDYKRVNQLCDLMLDTLHWSGGNTSLDALALGLPMVTLPGALMRGRQSMAMLARMGLTELIAADAADYARIALRLGRDADYRRGVTARILEQRDKVFDDPAPSRALAVHFRALVA